ncbi:hypothetical protein C2S51_033195 [Perilla frutescens var. frutescens]|nr:hypothetical protein C2S51_033195 [Perilla frutescens var. frutescens]
MLITKFTVLKNATPDRKNSTKTSADENSPVTSKPCHFTERNVKNMELEENASGNPGAAIASVPVNRCFESKTNFVSVPISDEEMRRQAQAATKAQAVFRGYLARRAFKALKGIIRLQALIRGHLVRRQAVATLRCMQAIVKFQALTRGRRVRLSNNMYHVDKKYNMEALQVNIGTKSRFGSEKLTSNAYVRKILLSRPTAIPLSLQYDTDEPNSALNWLERWSVSHFWKPPAHRRKVLSIKSQRKLVGSQIVESGAGKPKRSIRKASTAANGDNGALVFFETEKPKRNPRKVISHQTELVQELPQSELERVKRNSKKVSASVAVASKKPQQQLSSKTVLSSTSPDASEKDTVISAENSAGSDVIADKLAQLEDTSKPGISVKPVDALNGDCPLVESHPSENGDKMLNAPSLQVEVSPKEDESGKENQKIRKRRSLLAKQEYPENNLLNTQGLPSYMAATQSAKARLRIQGSSKFSEDGAEVGYVRRHSLPASTNGKLNSLSPRIQKLVQANGKGSSQSNRPVTSSREAHARVLVYSVDVT